MNADPDLVDFGNPDVPAFNFDDPGDFDEQPVQYEAPDLRQARADLNYVPKVILSELPQHLRLTPPQQLFATLAEGKRANKDYTEALDSFQQTFIRLAPYLMATASPEPNVGYIALTARPLHQSD